MAIIVDKVQKRRNIALSCSELLLEKGIKNLTIAEVAKTAGVSKGSIYDYFENKEDIVFEIIGSFIEVFHEQLFAMQNPNGSIREKVLQQFEFILNENDMFTKHQNIYKEYLGINLSSKNENMSTFNQECSNFFTKILDDLIDEGIQKGELLPIAKQLTEGLIATEKGFLMMSWTEDKNIQESFKQFLNTIFDLIEVKK